MEVKNRQANIYVWAGVESLITMYSSQCDNKNLDLPLGMKRDPDCVLTRHVGGGTSKSPTLWLSMSGPVFILSCGVTIEDDRRWCTEDERRLFPIILLFLLELSIFRSRVWQPAEDCCCWFQASPGFAAETEPTFLSRYWDAGGPYAGRVDVSLSTGEG